MLMVCRHLPGESQREILVYRHRLAQVLSDGERFKPFARFEPSEEGWLGAYLLIKNAKFTGMLNPKVDP